MATITSSGTFTVLVLSTENGAGPTSDERRLNEFTYDAGVDVDTTEIEQVIQLWATAYSLSYKAALVLLLKQFAAASNRETPERQQERVAI